MLLIYESNKYGILPLVEFLEDLEEAIEEVRIAFKLKQLLFSDYKSNFDARRIWLLWRWCFVDTWILNIESICHACIIHYSHPDNVGRHCCELNWLDSRTSCRFIEILHSTVHFSLNYSSIWLYISTVPALNFCQLQSFVTDTHKLSKRCRNTLLHNSCRRRDFYVFQ